MLQPKFVEQKNVRKIQLRISELDSPLPMVVEPTDKKRKVDTTNWKNVALTGLQPCSLKYQNVGNTSPTNSGLCTNDLENESNSSSDENETSMSAVEEYV